MNSYRFFSFVLALLFISPALLCAEEESIDLRNILQERTRQYAFTGAEKIFLNTPFRSGSTLVYNVLRFLFERDEQHPWAIQGMNLVVKFHVFDLFDPRAIYVCTIRHPLDAALSYYRVRSTAAGRLLPHQVFDEIIDEQVRAFEYLEGLKERGLPHLILRYEEFVGDFDLLFRKIEEGFGIVIDARDKKFLRRALSKDNVQRNIQTFANFTQADDYSFFHGNHIDQGEISSSFLMFAKSAALSRLQKHSELFKRWGYSLDPFTP